MSKENDKFPERNTRALAMAIESQLEKKLGGYIRKYLRSKQKNLETDLKSEEYLKKLIAREHTGTNFFQRIWTYPIRADVIVVPVETPTIARGSPDSIARIKSKFSSIKKELRLFEPWSFGDKIWNLRPVKQVVDRIIERSGTTKVKRPRFNQSPKCLISIEVERTKSRKYLLGSAFNASIFGKLGVVIYPVSRTRLVHNLEDYIRDFNKTRKDKILENVVFIKDTDFLAAIGYYDS